MSHAMLFTGLHIDNDNDNVMRWEVENSWGKDGPAGGYLMMSDNWFTEYVYQVVVSKEHLEKEELELYQSEPIVLDPWDPYGSLAL